MPVMDRVSPAGIRKQIGYFSHIELDNRHLGAILITDPIGIPVEFKYTEPVAATKLHRILYGASLDRHLHENVIRDRLSREIRSEPELFIAPQEEKEFLGTIGGKQMIAVQPLQPGTVESAGPFMQVREREAIVQIEDGPCLRLFFSTSDDAIQRRLSTVIQEFSRSMEILEPLERIEKALRMLCGEAKKGAAVA